MTIGNCPVTWDNCTAMIDNIVQNDDWKLPLDEVPCDQ